MYARDRGAISTSTDLYVQFAPTFMGWHPRSFTFTSATDPTIGEEWVNLFHQNFGLVQHVVVMFEGIPGM
jgi:hypothetical protein